jgi:predicted alpha/beta-hydrolase family hydrolase
VTIHVELDGGRSTTACHHAAASSEGALLVLAHGAGAGRTHPFMIAVADGLAARGIDVVTFDFPYMHERRHVPDRSPVLERCFVQVVTRARALDDLGSRKLFVGGKSMGGRMATHLGAHGLPGLRGIVVFGYPLHPPGKEDQLRTAHLPSVRTPLIVVQGDRDTFGTPAELHPVLAQMPAGATLHPVAGGDHSLSVRGRKLPQTLDPVLDAVRDWMSAR